MQVPLIEAHTLDGSSALDRFAAAVFVGSERIESRLMGLFTAFVDASGNSIDQPLVIVSGYIANFVQWQIFSGTWKSIHAKYGVSEPFHMAEFYAACTSDRYKSQRNAREDYIKIASDPPRWKMFLREITNAQTTFINCAVTCVVRMDGYNEIDKHLELRESIPPYALGARFCVDRVAKWETDFEIDERVEMIFEEGDLGQGNFSKIMVGEGRDLPTYKKKRDFAGLQGADHYAWEVANHLKKANNDPSFEPRIEFAYLLKAIPRLHIETTRETLAYLCNERGVKARSWRK